MVAFRQGKDFVSGRKAREQKEEMIKWWGIKMPGLDGNTGHGGVAQKEGEKD